MSLDTTIRFLTPVDPRAVWSAMSTIIEAPADYTWDRYPANPDMVALFAPNPTTLRRCGCAPRTGRWHRFRRGGCGGEKGRGR
jgi:hypothetical protein